MTTQHQQLKSERIDLSRESLPDLQSQGFRHARAIDLAIVGQMINETQAGIDHLEYVGNHWGMSTFERETLSRGYTAMCVLVELRSRMKGEV